MGQQEQRREVASSMKWVQSIVLSVNDGIAYFKSSFWF
jgi:glycerol-3-phosphate cytidylyltransferase-like family protein